MSSTRMNISHFLLSPSPGWGKNYYYLLSSFKDIDLIYLTGHVRPFCTLATRLVREQETIIVTLLVASQVVNKTRTEVSRHFLDESSESSKALQRIRQILHGCTSLVSYLCLELILKNPLAIQFFG